jgi:Transcriptional regulators
LFSGKKILYKFVPIFIRVRTRFIITVIIETYNKIRIKDIAILAGVSAGTVDRVIHNRGQVSEENKTKILKIIEELNYKPNLLARSLASKRNYLIVTLLPESKDNTGYWAAPTTGIQKGWKEIADHNVRLINLFYDQYNVKSFQQKFTELLAYKPDAVLIAPVFRTTTIQLVHTLDEQNIPYIFIDSNIEGVNNLAYFGQHSYQSGFLAARLLQLGLPENTKIAVITPIKKYILNQTRSRIEGFNAFFEQEGLQEKYTFLNFEYDIENQERSNHRLELFFRENPQIEAVAVFNSRVYEIAIILEKLKLKKIRLIGYDLLKENADYLRKGIVTFLLAQRPEEQGYQGILTLFNYLALKQNVTRIQYVPIDILTKENIDYYINFNK